MNFLTSKNFRTYWGICLTAAGGTLELIAVGAFVRTVEVLIRTPVEIVYGISGGFSEGTPEKLLD